MLTPSYSLACGLATPETSSDCGLAPTLNAIARPNHVDGVVFWKYVLTEFLGINEVTNISTIENLFHCSIKKYNATLIIVYKHAPFTATAKFCKKEKKSLSML